MPCDLPAVAMYLFYYYGNYGVRHEKVDWAQNSIREENNVNPRVGFGKGATGLEEPVKAQHTHQLGPSGWVFATVYYGCGGLPCG